MTDWDDRFASGEYPRAPEPSAVLRSDEPAIPDGRALDVAAGTGRNAVYLAEAGYAVEALDASARGSPSSASAPPSGGRQTYPARPNEGYERDGGSGNGSDERDGATADRRNG